MYRMEHLLILLTNEQAKELRFRAGSPPLLVSEDEQHSLQGPPITTEDIVRLLRDVASSRHMRDLRDRGEVQFVYTTSTRSPFLVRAELEGENVVFDVS
jgi:Tfp pilus assembly pilus retraction ATPase PilT